MTNARYRHDSTANRLKRDPRHPTSHLRNTLVPHLPTSDVIPSRQHHTHSKILHRECLGVCSSRCRPISDRKPPAHSSQTKRRIASCFIAPRRDETPKKLIRLFAKKKSSILPQRLTKRRIHLTHTHTALGIVQIRPGQQDLRKNCDHPNTLLHRRMLARPTAHLMYLTSFSARIDSFHSLLCRVYIVHDAHGVPNARYSHKSTADHLKCDPRKDHSSWTRVYV